MTPNDDTAPKKISKTPSAFTDDEDVVHFDLTGDVSETTDLHVDLADEDTTEEEVHATADKNNYDITLDKTSSPTFSLAGDDLMSLFEKLQQTVEEETQNYLKRQKQHRANISAEEEAMRREKMEYEQKKRKMLEGIEALRAKLSSPPSKVTK